MTARDGGLCWVKADASTGGNNCVEAAAAPDGSILVRDSKNREGAVLRFSRSEWDAFRTGVRDGNFDFPE